MLTAKDLTYSYFLERQSDYLPLCQIADVVSGLYTHSSEVLIFEDFRQTPDASVGYSRRLRDYVEVEADIAMPLLKPTEDIAFFNPKSDYKHRGIVLFEVKDRGTSHLSKINALLDEHPALKKYIDISAPEILFSEEDNKATRLNILNRKQSDILTTGKHILAIKDSGCESFFDSKGRYAISYDMYGIKQNNSSMADSLLSAIFNSSFFSYLRHQEQKRNELRRNSKYESVIQFPIPAKLHSSILLKALRSIVEMLTLSKEYSHSRPNSRIGHYLYQMLDMAIFELYLPDYVRSKGLSVAEDFVLCWVLESCTSASDRLAAVYNWFMMPDNKVRQKIMLLDSRSPELLYNIFTYLKR